MELMLFAGPQSKDAGSFTGWGIFVGEIACRCCRDYWIRAVARATDKGQSKDIGISLNWTASQSSWGGLCICLWMELLTSSWFLKEYISGNPFQGHAVIVVPMTAMVIGPVVGQYRRFSINVWLCLCVPASRAGAVHHQCNLIVVIVWQGCCVGDLCAVIVGMCVGKPGKGIVCFIIVQWPVREVLGWGTLPFNGGPLSGVLVHMLTVFKQS